VPARLEDEQATDVVEVVPRPAPSLEDGRSLEWRDAADDDPERLAGGVVVDRPNRERRLDVPRLPNLGQRLHRAIVRQPLAGRLAERSPALA
jgi:hypothetical protein